MPMVLGRPHTEQTPPFHLPVSFFALGFAGWLLGLLTLAAARQPAADGVYGAPGVLAAVHLLTLGFVTAFMSGALYQLTPVLLNHRLARPRLGMVHWALHLGGLSVLVAGMARTRPGWMVAGGGLIALGVLLFAGNLLATARGARQWPVSAAFVGWALAGLLGAVALGLLMAWRWLAGHPPLPLLPLHLALGLGGWFAAVLMGVSYKLLPMFLGGPARPRHSLMVVALLAAAVLLALAAPAAGRSATLAAALAAAAAAGLYLADVAAAWRARPPKPPDAAMTAMGLGALNLVLSLGLAAGGILSGRSVPWAGAALFLFLNGWLGISILGFLARILPFLIWLHRYGHRWAEGPLPRLTDLLPDRWVRAYTRAAAGTVWLTTAGLLARNSALTGWGAGTAALAVAGAALACLLAVGERAPEMARFKRPPA